MRREPRQDERRRRCWRLGAHDRWRQPDACLVAALVAGDLGTAVAEPDLVAVEAQLDSLVHESLGRAIEAAALAQVAIQWDAHAPGARPVEASGRQRPQHLSLLGQALGDREAAGCVPAGVADLLAPVGVPAVELGERAETPRRPEAALEIPHRRLDRALLARRRRRAGRRVEGVMAAQVEEAAIPEDLVALAAGDDRAQVVVDALARHAAQPLERAYVPLQERLERHLEAEERRLRARVGQARNEHVDAPLTAEQLRAVRHLRPVELQHLTRPVAGPLRRPHRRRPQLTQPALGDVDRTAVTEVGAQELGRPRRPDQRPLLQQAPQHRLERVKLRAHRRPSVARRLTARGQASDRPPTDPEPPRDLPLRQPVRPQRLHPRPLQRAPHLPPPRLGPITTSRACEASRSDQRRGEWRTFRRPIPAQHWTPGVIRSVLEPRSLHRLWGDRRVATPR